MSVLNRTSVAKLIGDLEDTLDKKEEALDNEGGKDSPNDDRCQKLEEEMDLLTQIKDICEEYINLG